eukprot:540543-Rhodomonas_salina.1
MRERSGCERMPRSVCSSVRICEIPHQVGHFQRIILKRSAKREESNTADGERDQHVGGKDGNWLERKREFCCGSSRVQDFLTGSHVCANAMRAAQGQGMG